VEERKFATVVFADFVESTAIAGAYDPEVVRAAYGAIFSRMRDILEAHGGTVEKFIGDAVMAVFGVPTSHEDDALRAVRAAFALREDSSRRIAGSSIRVTLRVGVNTGEVVAATSVRRDFLVTGQAVNVGFRLQSAAQPGQILVGDLTHELTASQIEYAPKIAVAAKGLGTVNAWAALDARHEPVAPAVRSAALVDRESEMGVLAAAYARVRAERRPCLVTVYGAAGVGKTRLADEFVARERLPLVRRGRCVAYGEGATLAPLQSIVRADASIGRADRVEDGLRKLRTTCEALFRDAQESERALARLSVLAGLAPVEILQAEVPEESIAQELDWSLRRYVEERAADGTLTLIFEDAHWAEPTLLDTIEHLADWARGAILILCLARPEFVAKRPSWGAGRPNSVTLSLGPLESDDARDLVSSLLPSGHAAALDDIVRRSEGNPFYAEELVRLLIATGEPMSTVPATLHGLIAARLDAVEPGVKALLQRASVVGRVFWTDVLGELGEDRVTMRAQLLAAMRHDFVVELPTRGPGGGWAYRFTHGLTRDVSYASVSKAERSTLHDRLSRWLERVVPTRGIDDLETIASHAERAYGLASEVGSPQMDALGRRALELLVVAARAADAQGDLRRAETLFQRVLTIARGTHAGAAAMLEPRAHAAIARLRRDSSADALADVRRVLDDARASGPSEILATLLRWSAMYAPYASPQETASLYDEAADVARSLGDASILARSLRASARPAFASGQLTVARRLLVEARDLTTASEHRVIRARILLDLASSSLDQGSFTAAKAEIDEALPLAQDLVGRVIAHRRHAQLWQAIGDDERAVAPAEAAVAGAREIGSPWGIADAAALLGAILRERGDASGSRKVLDEATLYATARAPAAALWRVHCELALTAIADGRIDEARDRCAAAERSRPAEPAAVAMVTATQGLVAAAAGDLRDANRLFKSATVTLEATELALQLASMRLDHARALIAARRVDDAVPILRRARTFYADPLARPRLDEIDALLANASADARRAVAD